MEVHAKPSGYDVSFFKAGSLPGPVRFQRRARAPTWCVLSREGNEEDARPEERFIGGLLQRYFQRGINAAPTRKLEQRTVQLADPEDGCRPAKCGYQVLEAGHRPNMRGVASVIAHQHGDHDPVLDPSLREAGLFDSETERIFLEDWVPRALGPSAARLWPQFPMGSITGDLDDERRVDFLYEGKTARRRIAVEIDGEDHQDWRAVDESREDSAARAGVKTIRVTNHEVHGGTGPNLTLLEMLVRKDQDDHDDVRDERSAGWAGAITMADEGTAFQILLSRMLEDGSLPIANGTVGVEAAHARPHGLEESFDDWRELARAFAEVHGVADNVRLPRMLRLVSPGEEHDQPVHIRVEGACPWWHTTDVGGRAHILRRVDSNVELHGRVDVSPEWRELRGPIEKKAQEQALLTILNDAFRYAEFREAQARAIGRCLNDKDTVVLLPTSAGKSLIYQMISLLKPGPTIVVAPLVALIEDQIDALQSVGIDRVEGITSLDDERTRREKMTRLTAGTTLIVVCAPERLMIPEFREQMSSLAAAGLAQVVIDEAHCISEWGHDFRPAYLQLGRTVKERLGKPPVLALTGTASRAVYKDMIAHLEIDDGDPEAAIRPTSHNRPEIKMELRYCTDRRQAQSEASGALRRLPHRFHKRSEQFWAPKRGQDTMCGIVFMPTVRGRGNSVSRGKELAQQCGARAIETYSSGENRQRRRDAARNFKKNDASTMVCTKAYGMGIDKPNVRWVLHPHLTGTLEGYYQEIGRAGRDQLDAIAIAIMREDDPTRTNAILDPRKDWDEAKRIYEDRRLSDDVGTSLFFHFRNFQGVQTECAAMTGAIDLLAPGEGAGERNIPFPADEDERTALERALGRLTRIGVVRDYEVDYGRRAFIAYVSPWKATQGVEGLAEYIARFDKTQSQEIERKVNAACEACQGDAEAEIHLVATELVNFVYRSVERAHRRALLETVEMARVCGTDEEVRRRMLDYLSEGKSSEKVAELLDRKEGIDWQAWGRLFEGVTPDSQMDAGELRGMFIRALESQPDHPALLASRAAAEALCSDGVFDVAERNLQTAAMNLRLYASGEKLRVERDNLAQFIRGLGAANPSLLHATRLIFGPWAADEDARTFGELVSAWPLGAADTEDVSAGRLEAMWGLLGPLGAATKTLSEAQVRLDTHRAKVD